MVKKKDKETQVAQDGQPVIVEGSESDTHTENPDISNTEIVNDDNSIAAEAVTSEVKTTSTTVVLLLVMIRKSLKTKYRLFR